jgi:uncharacterized protein YmfQ (DUF2313 family)
MLIQKIPWVDQLQQLLPQGTIWDYEEGSNIDGLILALQSQLQQTEFNLVDLYNDLMPDSTSGSFLTHWEELVGLPNECSIGVSFTEQQRRDNLLGQLNATGGQSIAYYIDVMTNMGYPDNTITEFSPTTIDGDIDDFLYGEEWNFVWQVNIPTFKIEVSNIDGNIDDSLDSGGDQWLECLIKSIKPAHTMVLFNYTG